MVRLQSKEYRGRFLVLHVFLSPVDCPAWVNQIFCIDSSDADAERKEIGRRVGRSAFSLFQRILHSLGGAVWSGSEMWSFVGAQWQKHSSILPRRRSASRADHKTSSPSSSSIREYRGDDTVYCLRVLLQSPLLRAGNCSTHSPLLILCRAAVTLMDHVHVSRTEGQEEEEEPLKEVARYHKTHLVKAHVRIVGCPRVL